MWSILQYITRTENLKNITYRSSYDLVAQTPFKYIKITQLAYGSKEHFLILESHVIRFLKYIAMESFQEKTEKLTELHFLYIYIIDELVHYGTREEAADTFIQLSSLLFTVLFSRHPIRTNDFGIVDSNEETSQQWPEHLDVWVTKKFKIDSTVHRVLK